MREFFLFTARQVKLLPSFDFLLNIDAMTPISDVKDLAIGGVE